MSRTASRLVRYLSLFLVLSLGLIVPGEADDGEWKQAGSLFLLTTPEGAALPASVKLEDFPVLVRLHHDFFDFRQARADGGDIRFTTASGTPLAYQIEEWDPDRGEASIWVRMPIIQGNTRQEIRMRWGKPDATSESDGKAVFNASNGYLTVFHMDADNQDAVGNLKTRDSGTKPIPGIIGQARRLIPQKGITAGDKITGFPVGSSPHSTEVWFRGHKPNGRVLAWGNEHGQGKVTMQFRSPPQVRMECYFSGADVSNKTPLAMDQWVHVVHTYEKGDSKIYLNGVLDGETKTASAPLALRSPARFNIGGWYENYDFTGDIDEVRISQGVRSPEWIRLEYENQKPGQTLVGPLVQNGTAFSVSHETISLPEGKNVSLSAKAGGAQKIYWVLQRDDKETIVATDRFTYTLDAGRVVGDQHWKLRFKAIYPTEVKTIDVPVTIQEAIPEPVVRLQGPTSWDGRQTIEIIPEIANQADLKARGADKLHTVWNVSGLGVIQEPLPDRLILRRSQNSGRLTVTATVDNGGKPTTASLVIDIKEPGSDPWVLREPSEDEKPEEGQFYPRDASNQGTLYYNGTLDKPAFGLFLKVYADDQLVETVTTVVGEDKKYRFKVKLKPGLIKYRVELGFPVGAQEQILEKVGDLVCGDAYLINGQSNALATDTGEKSPPETSEWIRSYGGPTGRGDGKDWVRDRLGKAGEPKKTRPNLWCRPVWKAEKGEKAELGWWGMELAKRLVTSQKMPIFIIQGAVGGTRIDEHQPTSGNHADLKTIYGRALWRVQQAKMTHGIKAVLWHQGESDQGSDGPDGGYGWESYERYFVNLAAAWKQDMPNIQHYYVFQIWPNACSMGNSHGDMLREVQRNLPRLYSNLSILSTLGIKPGGGCHYPLIGWSEFARYVQPLMERDFYGKQPTSSITPPNLKSAVFNSDKTAVILEFDQPVTWMDGLASQFYLDGVVEKNQSGSASGSTVTILLKEPTRARTVSYLKEMRWNPEKLLRAANGIAALSFSDVVIKTP